MILQAYFIESYSPLPLSLSILTSASEDVFSPNSATRSCYGMQQRDLCSCAILRRIWKTAHLNTTRHLSHWLAEGESRDPM